MQSFSATAYRAAQNTRLSDSLRYAAQRWAELLDPHSHFAASASFTFDPATAAREFRELARAHSQSGGRNPSAPVMHDTAARTRRAFASDRRLALWYPAERQAVIAALDALLSDSQRQAATPVISRAAWTRACAESAARGAVRDLHLAMTATTGGFRERLLDRVCTAPAPQPATAAAWRSFDEDLRMLAAIAWAEGRDPRRFGTALTSAIAVAQNDAEALNRVRRHFCMTAEPYVVAVALDGVREATRAPRFGCRRLGVATTWDTSARPTADARLTAFVAAHAGADVVLVDVTAYDYEQAYVLAEQRAERLLDQYSARHRAYTFPLRPQALALCVSTAGVKDMSRSVSTPPRPRTLLKAPDSRLEQSLRYAALARAEQAPVVQVLHSWIALETLARGRYAPVAPYRFLLTRLSALLAVHAVRQGLTSSWHVVSRSGRRGTTGARWNELETWLGVRGVHRNLPDLNRWVDVLRHDPPANFPPPASLAQNAPMDEAAAFLQSLLPTLTPFARVSVEQWRWLLERGGRLSNWCDDVEAGAQALLGRMYVMRNSSVHAALVRAAGIEQLSHASRLAVDTVYEVLPAWLKAGKPAWRAFEGVYRRSRHVRETWSRRQRPALVNASRLTRPGGDGLARP